MGLSPASSQVSMRKAKCWLMGDSTQAGVRLFYCHVEYAYGGLKMTTTLNCGIVLTALALAASPAAAQYAPWCFSDSGRRGGTVTCTFYSFEQCMATARGIGGSCSPNPLQRPNKPQQR
jgi:hypothetical protein